MKATANWLATTCPEYSGGLGEWGCAQLKHYTAAYREWGDGPPLVLVPGLAGGMDLLGPLARCLASRFRVITYQLRGEDDCFVLRRRFGLTDLVDDLAEFLDYHCLERPALLGVSFGGVLALELAAREPRRLSRLAVQGVGAWFESGLVQRLAGLVLSQYLLPPDNPFINQFFNLLFGCPQQEGPLFRFVTQRCWQTDQSVMAHRFEMLTDFDLREQLEHITLPTLILAGERDVVVSRSSLQALAAGISSSCLVRLANAGHLAFLTHAQRMAGEIDHFLTELSD